MKIGDIVRQKHTGDYGTVEYSTFGFSIHIWKEFDGQPCLSKTLGATREELEPYWEVVELPEGYEIGEYGGVRRIKPKQKVYVVIRDNVSNNFDSGVIIDSIQGTKEKAESRVNKLKRKGQNNPYWEEQEVD